MLKGYHWSWYLVALGLFAALTDVARRRAYAEAEAKFAAAPGQTSADQISEGQISED